MTPSTGNTANRLPLTMEETPLSPEEQAHAQARQGRYLKNRTWFEAHVREIRDKHAGHYICVAGETLFSGDDAAEVYARARAAFPADWGAFFTMYLQPKR